VRAIEEGGLSPKTVAKMPTEHDVSKGEVVSVNRRFAGPDHNLNAPLRQDGESEWQDWLVDAWDGGE
jgi:RNA polymerase sigma-32 factor